MRKNFWMNYNIKTISVFDKNIKKLAKKHSCIKTDFAELLESLRENPKQGTLLGNNSYKIRMQISSKNKGKSGGARLISHFIIQDETIYLLTIYDKSEQGTISDKELRDLINLIE